MLYTHVCWCTFGCISINTPMYKFPLSLTYHRTTENFVSYYFSILPMQKDHTLYMRYSDIWGFTDKLVYMEETPRPLPFWNPKRIGKRYKIQFKPPCTLDVSSNAILSCMVLIKTHFPRKYSTHIVSKQTIHTWIILLLALYAAKEIPS